VADGDVFAWAGWFSGTIWVTIKVLAFLYAYVWFRATLPRLRYDQLMDFGWKLLIPVALGWFLVLAVLQMARAEYDDLAPVLGIGAAAVVVLFLGYALFTVALDVARRNRERDGEAY
jgi:NADH-quinone oxidoreductase subunit H